MNRTAKRRVKPAPTGNWHQVDNVKWRKNDFDEDGWRNQKHSENRPMFTFTATYDNTDQSLNHKNELMGRVLYFDLKKGDEIKWVKIK